MPSSGRWLVHARHVEQRGRARLVAPLGVIEQSTTGRSEPAASSSLKAREQTLAVIVLAEDGVGLGSSVAQPVDPERERPDRVRLEGGRLEHEGAGLRARASPGSSTRLLPMPGSPVRSARRRGACRCRSCASSMRDFGFPAEVARGGLGRRGAGAAQRSLRVKARGAGPSIRGMRRRRRRRWSSRPPSACAGRTGTAPRLSRLPSRIEQPDQRGPRLFVIGRTDERARRQRRPGSSARRRTSVAAAARARAACSRSATNQGGNRGNWRTRVLRGSYRVAARPLERREDHVEPSSTSAAAGDVDRDVRGVDADAGPVGHDAERSRRRRAAAASTGSSAASRAGRPESPTATRTAAHAASAAAEAR